MLERRAKSEFAGVALSALPALFNAALRLTGREADAEDLVQDTYVLAFERSVQLRSLAACRPWLFQIMRNRFISLYRNRRAVSQMVVIEGVVENTLSGDDVRGIDREEVARLSRDEIRVALND